MVALTAYGVSRYAKLLDFAGFFLWREKIQGEKAFETGGVLTHVEDFKSLFNAVDSAP